MGPEFDLSAQDLAAKFDALAISEANVERIAGSVAQLHISYVAKSKWLGFPDYISAKFIALTPEKSTLSIHSRSRFGYSDMGVNESRVQRWLTALNGSG